MHALVTVFKPLHIYTHTYTRVCVYIYIDIHTHTYTHTFVHVRPSGRRRTACAQFSKNSGSVQYMNCFCAMLQKLRRRPEYETDDGAMLVQTQCVCTNHTVDKQNAHYTLTTLRLAPHHQSSMH